MCWRAAKSAPNWGDGRSGNYQAQVQQRQDHSLATKFLGSSAAVSDCQTAMIGRPEELRIESGSEICDLPNEAMGEP